MILLKNEIRKRAINLALPIVAEQAAVMLLGIINTIMVGRLGKEAVSAVGMVDMFSRCIFPIFSGLATGGTILVAHSIGGGEKKKACEIAKQALYSGAVLSIIIVIIINLAKVPILQLLYGAADDLVINYAFDYFSITIFSYPFMFIYYLTNGVLRGSGDTRTPMRVTLIMNVISAVLSYFLIYGIDIHKGWLNLHQTGYGVEGAAWGVSIARVIGALINAYILLCGNKVIKILHWNRYKINLKTVLDVMKLGIPYGLEQFSLQTGKLILQIIIIGMGTIAIAANTIGMSIMSLCITLGYGFNLAAVTLVGQALGAGNPEEAKKDTKEVLKINILFMTVMSIVIVVLAPQLFSLYTDDNDVIACGISIIRIYALSQPLLAIVQVLSGSLRGGGDTKYPMLATFIGVWFFRLLFGYILGILCGMGINGVWIAMTIDLALRAILFIIRYKKGKWQTMLKREVKEERGGYL